MGFKLAKCRNGAIKQITVHENPDTSKKSFGESFKVNTGYKYETSARQQLSNCNHECLSPLQKCL